MSELIDDKIEVETDEDFEVVVDESEEHEGAEPTDEPAEPGESTTGDVPADEPDSAEAADGSDTGDAEELDEEVKGYSKQVQKRIFREIRLRKKHEAEAVQAKTIVAKAHEIIQQRDRELQEARERVAQVELQHAEVLDHAFATQIALKSKELKAAREAGEYDTELQLQGEVDELRFRLNQVREHKRGLEARKPAQAPARSEAPTPQAQPQRQAPQANPAAQKWLAKNKAWFENPKFAAHKQFALAVDTQLTAEGYNQMTDEYFAELDRRIDEAFPTMRKKSATPQKSPVAAAAAAAPATGKKNTVRLTSADLQMMRNFGLDPNNKEHLREYARNKRTAA